MSGSYTNDHQYTIVMSLPISVMESVGLLSLPISFSQFFHIYDVAVCFVTCVVQIFRISHLLIESLRSFANLSAISEFL